MKLTNVIVFAAALLGASEAFSFSSWDSKNHPGNFSNNFERKFKRLPKSGKLSKQPWTDSYWPTYQGGISYRWLTGEVKYSTPGRNSQGIAYLSPAEKFDLYVGDKNFSLTNYERKRTGIFTSREIPEWEGLCHAWAPAAYLYKEPRPVTVTGRNGDKIQFGSTDIKALLTYHLHLNKGRTKFLGSRCNLDAKKSNIEGRRECDDTNAGAFHIVLTNLIGKQNTSFVIDKTRDAEVWNQPVEAYSVQVLGRSRGRSRGAAQGTKREVTVKTVVRWVSEIDQEWNAVGTHLETSTYKYRLELDRKGRIIGGTWISWERPDFIWTQTRPAFKGFLAPLKDIYRKSIR